MSSMIHPEREAYSANVRVCLRVNGSTLEVAQVGDGFCILRDHQPHAPSDAELDIIVDGRKVTHHIFLCNGILDNLRRVAFI
jgi:hypothetical protein